jgi:two-component system response regulator TctD
MRILVVEDNVELAQWLVRTLRKQQYTVDVISNGADADFALQSETYNLVVLDLALPKLDGKEVLRRLRARKDMTPVLVLTANWTMVPMTTWPSLLRLKNSKPASGCCFDARQGRLTR